MMWYAEWCECMVNDIGCYNSPASIHRVHDISPILPHVVADCTCSFNCMYAMYQCYVHAQQLCIKIVVSVYTCTYTYTSTQCTVHNMHALASDAFTLSHLTTV